MDALANKVARFIVSAALFTSFVPGQLAFAESHDVQEEVHAEQTDLAGASFDYAAPIENGQQGVDVSADLVDEASGELASKDDQDATRDAPVGTSDFEAVISELTPQAHENEEIVTPSSRSVADGVYEVTSALDMSKALDISGGSLDDCTRVQLWSANASRAQRFRFIYDEASGFYSITNIGSGKALDAAGGSSANGTAVQQYGSNGTLAQLWAVELDGDGYRICSAIDAEQVLDVPGAAANDGTTLQLYRANGTAAQRWCLNEIKPVKGGRSVDDGVYRITSLLNNNLAIDIAFGSLGDGGNAQLYSVNQTAAQLFRVKLGDDGFYTITNMASGKVLDVSSGSSGAGANVQQWFSNGTDAQKWAIVLNEDGSCSVVSKLGTNLDVAGALSQSGANLQTWVANGTQAQSFCFESASSPRSIADGVYGVASALDGSKVLDVPGASVDNGARIQLWSENASQAQRFRFTYDEASGFYLIINVGSGKALDAAAGSWANGTAVQQYESNGTAAQLWSIEPDGDGFRICSAINSAQVLDVPCALADEGAALQLYEVNGTTAQRWHFALASCPVDLSVSCGGNAIRPIDAYSGTVYLTLPSYATTDSINLTIANNRNESIWVGGLPLSDSETIGCTMSELGLDFSPEGKADCSLRDASGSTCYNIVFMRSSDCASIFLTSEDAEQYGRDYVEASLDHTASAKGSMRMISSDGSIVYDGALGQIKGRGNSTWNADKKPYQIKLKKKTDLLESGDASNKNKTWVLLANAYDASAMRNIISYSIAQDLGVKSAVEFRVVDLYYDSEYRGTYLLTEKVQVNSGRVGIADLEEENENVNQDSFQVRDVEGVNSYGHPMKYTEGLRNPVDISGGYLIEADARYAQERSWFSVGTKWGPVYFVCKSPEGWSYEEANYLSCFVQDAFDAMINGGTNPRTGKSTQEYIDTDSFVSLYWVNEITKNRDGFVFSSTYAYKDANGADCESKLVFGPAWDFDLSLGNRNADAGEPSDWVVGTKGWYTRDVGLVPLFMRDPQVLNAMNASRNDVVAATRNYLANEFLGQKAAVESSMKLNAVVWGLPDESCSDVVSWLNQRLDWLSGVEA